MGNQLNIVEIQKLTAVHHKPVFDRAVLAQQTMDDACLQREILSLFVAQIAKLEQADWGDLDFKFEMHTLRGAAAAVGAAEIEDIAIHWTEIGPGLEAALRQAFSAFELEAAVDLHAA